MFQPQTVDQIIKSRKCISRGNCDELIKDKNSNRIEHVIFEK